VEPARVIEAWRGPAVTAQVARLARENGIWRLYDHRIAC
jgi:tRNA 5-methylaminomethyl-2-thiouridine biosynthesis bifunctional protein